MSLILKFLAPFAGFLSGWLLPRSATDPAKSATIGLTLYPFLAGAGLFILYLISR